MAGDVASGAGVRFGPAGWSYPDWKARAYPRRLDEHPLSFLARYVDTVEVNTTFYQPVAAATSRRWVALVAGEPRFRFTVKLWRGFTHADEPVGVAAAAEFRAGLEPLRAAGLLGAVLAQFPWSFRRSPLAMRRLEEVCRAFASDNLVVEFRHGSWDVPHTLAFLSECGVGFCNVDQPLFSDSLGPTEHLTAGTAYVRLHGRNREAWFDPGATRDTRYDYLYSLSELKPWADTIARLARRAETVYVVTNNHFRASALVNALELRSLVTGETPSAPPCLRAAYPRLGGLTRELSSCQPSLFPV